MAPYAMLPWSLWQTEFAQMLMVVCEYYPTQSWNTMLLAEDERSSAVLGLPVHPGAYPHNLQATAILYLTEYRKTMDAAHRQADEALAQGELGMRAFGKAVDDLKANVAALAHILAGHTFGDEVYDRHLEMFGKMLGWPHAK